MAVRVNSSYNEYRSFYRQVQFIEDDDTRSLEQRLNNLPTIRDEDMDEWEEWIGRNVFD